VLTKYRWEWLEAIAAAVPCGESPSNPNRPIARRRTRGKRALGGRFDLSPATRGEVSYGTQPLPFDGQFLCRWRWEQGRGCADVLVPGSPTPVARVIQDSRRAGGAISPAATMRSPKGQSSSISSGFKPRQGIHRDGISTKDGDKVLLEAMNRQGRRVHPEI